MLSRRVRLRFSLGFSLSQKFTFCVNSKIRNLLIFPFSAFHRSGEIDLQKTRTKSKDGHAYIMSKFENVLKAQKVKTTFFARFVVILLLLAPMLLSRGVFFSSSFFLLGERARAQCSEGLSLLHFFFIPTGNDPISRITHSRSLSFLFSTTHA